MYRTHRFLLAVAIAATAASVPGCGKGKDKDKDPTADTTPAPQNAPPPPNNAAKPEKPSHPEKPGAEKPGEHPDKPAAEKPTAPPSGGEAGFHWEVHKPTNIKFELPTDWTVSIAGDKLVTKTPTPGVFLEFWGAEGKLSAKADEKALLKEVGKTLQKAKLNGKPKLVEQNGLKGHVSAGTGFKDGEVEWLCAVLGDGKNKDMLTLAFYSPKLGGTYKSQLQKVLDSIGINK
jgi:hypothetical protein